MAHSLLNSPFGDTGVAVSSAPAGGAAPKHKATAIAVARAIEARPRSEPLYIIGLNFLVIRALRHRLDVKAPGTETVLAISRLQTPKRP